MPLTEEQNQRLTRVGPGTPGGDLLRRYWHPIAGEAEMAPGSKKAIRILGEDFVLYRLADRTFGLIERHCPHRRADFIHGYVEPDGIRCSYHGWKFGPSGACLHQPFEEAVGLSRFRDTVAAQAYRAEARFGLVWAYLGPEPAPLIPTWEPFTYEDCFVQVVLHEVACNWLQCQENSIDPVHFEWLHANWSAGQSGQPDGYRATHIKLGFDEWDHGFVYKRLHRGDDETSSAWLDGRVCIMPNLFAPAHFEWRVPIDDERTLSLVWHADPVPEDRRPYRQDVIPCWWAKMHAEDGTPLTSHVLHQDVVSWEGQGTIADRTKEHLGRGDRGVQLFRKRLLNDIAAVERGEDPSGLIRDADANQCIKWPYDASRLLGRPVTTNSVQAKLRALRALLPSMGDDRFFLVAGQPESVREAWDEVMGLAAPAAAEARA